MAQLCVISLIQLIANGDSSLAQLEQKAQRSVCHCEVQLYCGIQHINKYEVLGGHRFTISNAY